MKKAVFIILAILIVLVIFFVLYKVYYKKEDISLPNINNSEVKEENYSASLLAVGDALIHSGIYKKAQTSDGYDFTSTLTEVTDIVKMHDITYVNQESPFANKAPANYPRINTPTEWGDALINAGFNMFSFANNHAMDQNESGVLDTLSYIQTKDVYYSGINDSFENQDIIKISEVNGISYAMIAYTEHTNGLPVPTGKEYLVNVYSKELAEKHINSIKDKVDVIIVSMHWGYEYKEMPNDYQTNTAKELADMGVDIILGSHPHWIQPIDYIDDTLVVYSLGNFLSAQMQIADRYPYTDSVTVGAMVTLDINKTVKGDETNININNLNVELVYSHYSSSDGYKVIPFSKMSSHYDKDYINLYEKHKTRLYLLNDTFTVSSLAN